MPTMIKPASKHRTAALTFLLLFILGACAPAAVPQPPQTIVQTVEVTQVVTHVVTAEVTQVVEVPVTNTPTPTLEQTATPYHSPTRTRIPSATPTWSAPRVSILEHTACLYGPGSGYLYKYGLNATVWMRVIGRNEDGSWLAIKSTDDRDSNACWVKTTQVKFLSGEIKDVPVFWIGLPYSVLYLPPQAVSTTRVGNEVTIFWQPVWMTEDDYRGYMIEAWVCQGGKQVFQPIGYVTSYAQNQKNIANKDVLAVKVIDEPGCDLPSRARLYSVEKHGYTNYIMVPWPAFEPAATATP